MSNVNKKKSPAKNQISTVQSENNNLSDIFEFYARIVKLIILRKDDADAVSRYSTWLAALRKQRDAGVRLDYVRLLLMALDRGGSAWPFDDYPPDVIDPVDGNWTKKARSMFRRDTPARAPTPPLVTAVSDDKCQFAAYQTVPGAGLQCYYARSDRPLYEWSFKSGSSSRPPDDWPAAVQAVPLAWERSLAGVHRVREEPSVSWKTSVSMQQRPSKLSLTREWNFGNNVNHCRILDTFQEILNLGEAKFKWYDKSLLTGDIIPGSDLCIDWSIHEHEKTQLDIDEEMVWSFDKLYPDKSRLVAKPELLEGIIKTMECADRDVRIIADECEKLPRGTRVPRQCAGKDPLQCSASPEKMGKPYSDENPTSKPELTPYRAPLLEASDHSNVLDTKPSVGKLEDCLVPRSIFEHRDEYDDANECQVELPPFTEDGESFNSIVNEAENIIRAVNDWLKTKDLI